MKLSNQFNALAIILLVTTSIACGGGSSSGSSSEDAAPVSRDDFVGEVTSSTGAEFTDCGEVDVDSERDTIDGCVENSFASGQSFAALYNFNEDDEITAKAITSDSEGRVTLFQYQNKEGTEVKEIREEICEVPVLLRKSTMSPSDLPLICLEEESTVLADIVPLLSDSYVPMLRDTIDQRELFGVDAESLYLIDTEELAFSEIQIFIYGTELEADEVARRISSDGYLIEVNDTPSDLNWFRQPNFYQYGNAIILYLGTQAKMLSGLEEAVGKSFAGGPNDDPQSAIVIKNSLGFCFGHPDGLSEVRNAEVIASQAALNQQFECDSDLGHLAIPTPDFTKNTVVLLESGNLPNPSHSLSLIRVVENEDNIIVKYRISSPTLDPNLAVSQVIVNPTILFTIPITGKEVVFEQID